MDKEEYADSVDCQANDINTAEKEDDIKFMDEIHEDTDVMEPQRYESLRRGQSTNEEQDNLSNEIIQYSGDEYAMDRLTSLESGAYASESDNVDINDNDEYLTPVTQMPQYTEIVDRDIITEVSPAGSQVIKERQHIVRVPFFRQFSEACRKIPIRAGRKRYSSKSDRDKMRSNRPPPCKRQASRSMKAVSVACSPQFITLLVLVIAICVIMAVILIVMFNMFNRKQDPPNAAAVIEDSILPDLKCPPSQTVILSQESKHITLEGAISKDNVGIKILEYKPFIEDTSAIYQPPFKLVLTRESVGHTYTVTVTAIDYSDNEAVCTYTIVVKEDLCVPWRLPELKYATRQESETSKGWQVTYQCVNNFTQEGAPWVVSYYYGNSAATFSCRTGEDFTPNKPFSCQEVTLAQYQFITSLEYRFLNANNDPLKNITVGKSQNCFNKYYKKSIISIQQHSANLLEDKIKAAASSSSSYDFSSLELKPILPGYPEIKEIKEGDGIVESLDVAFGYKVGPEDYSYARNALNIFVKGILKSYHTNLFMDGMMSFSQVEGNTNAGCPRLQAPPMLTSFEEVSSDFICQEDEKRVSIYDQKANTDVEACIGCPVGEYYDVVLASCQLCSMNTYQDEFGSDECKSCPQNTQTERAGATKVEQCIPI